MSAPAFTPGPWEWALDRQGQHTSLRQSGSGDSVVHPQVDISNYGMSVNEWNDVSDADARLIAAAPELLEALRPFAALAEAFRPDDARRGLAFTTPNLSPSDFIAARAALAKAVQS